MDLNRAAKQLGVDSKCCNRHSVQVGLYQCTKATGNSRSGIPANSREYVFRKNSSGNSREFCSVLHFIFSMLISSLDKCSCNARHNVKVHYNFVDSIAVPIKSNLSSIHTTRVHGPYREHGYSVYRALKEFTDVFLPLSQTFSSALQPTKQCSWYESVVTSHTLTFVSKKQITRGVRCRCTCKLARR